MIIIHGEDISKSRQYLARLKTKGKEIIVLDGAKTNLTEIKQALEAKSLFGQEKQVVIENLLMGRGRRGMASQKKDEVLVYLREELPKDIDLILWEEKEVPKSLLTLFPQATVSLFRPEPILFKFLEILRPGNFKTAYPLLQKTLGLEEPELVFYMLVRQFRMLLMVKDGYTRGISELERLSSWQIERLQNQAKYFTMEKLRQIYHKLLEIDLEQKTGRAVFDLGKTLELFLREI